MKIKEIYTEEVLNQFEKEATEALLQDRFCQLFVDNPDYAKLFLGCQTLKSIDDIENWNPTSKCLLPQFVQIQEMYMKEYRRICDLKRLTEVVAALRHTDVNGPISLFGERVSSLYYRTEYTPSQRIIARDFSISLDMATIKDLKRILEGIRAVRESNMHERIESMFDEVTLDLQLEEDDSVDFEDPAKYD